MAERMWAVDVEGSGKSPPEIVELAIVELDGLELTGHRKHWRLRPRNGISPIASRIHGIWDRDVEDAPEVEDVVDDLLTWLEDKPIVGHNVRVELGILTNALEGWAPSAAYDTLKLARRLLPDQPKYGLEHLGSALKLDAEAARITGALVHSAPYDAVLSALLLRHLLAPLDDTQRTALLAEADIRRGEQPSLL
jgi:DNA polymerase III subunit epsilon